MPDVLYITSSSYSGSTLLSFLLNAHPELTTTGEMEGWNPSQGGDFPCSCGVPVQSCPFFQEIGKAVEANGLQFGKISFGTAYQLLDNKRFNRYLTGAFPGGIFPWLEGFRDSLIRRTAFFGDRIRQTDKTNLVYIESALRIAGAKVFVDAQKDCYRIRFLKQIPEFNVKVLYLIRDMKGVVASHVRIKHWPVRVAARKWLEEQWRISRIFQQCGGGLMIDYDTLCEEPLQELNRIYDFLGVSRCDELGNFRETEHHILGNSMRLDNVGTIKKSLRWRKELSRDDITVISAEGRGFLARNPDHLISPYVASYLHPDSLAGDLPEAG